MNVRERELLTMKANHEVMWELERNPDMDHTKPSAQRFRTHAREQNSRMLRDRLVEREKNVAHMNSCAQGGEVCLVIDSMDCDCYRVTYGVILPAVRVVVEDYVNQLYEDAEGPTSVYITHPDEMPERQERDLALEAYEDGHPHVVYY